MGSRLGAWCAARSLVRLVACTLAFGVLGLGARAQASPSFPGAIQDYLEKTGAYSACPPPCLLCHTSPQGGASTRKDEGVETRTEGALGYGVFLANLSQAGKDAGIAKIGAGDTASLAAALAALEKNPCDGPPPAGVPPGPLCDSDSDQLPDVAELRQARDPDVPGEGSLAHCPKYGCGASIAPRPRLPRELDGALFCALGLLAVACRRLSRR